MRKTTVMALAAGVVLGGTGTGITAVKADGWWSASGVTCTSRAVRDLDPAKTAKGVICGLDGDHTYLASVTTRFIAIWAVGRRAPLFIRFYRR